MDNRFELVENFPIWAIEPMVNDEWGSYLQFNGEELARADFKDIDNYMKSHGFCGIAAPSDEMYDQTYQKQTPHPAFGKGTDTCSVYAIKGEWDPLIEQFDLGSDSEVEDTDKTNITIAGVKQLITELGMEITNIWYDGNKSRPVFDCIPVSNPSFPGGPICVLVEEPYEARIWLKTANPRNNGLVEDITSLEALQNELADLLNNPPVDQEQEYGKYIDRAMMDHYDSMNGDIGDIDFQCDMRNTRNNTRQHILTESIADDSFQYTATVSSIYPNDNARVYIYTVSDNVDLLTDICTYFSSKCNDNFKYILSDNPHIRIEDLRGVYDDPTDWHYFWYKKPCVYAEVVVSTTDDTTKEQIKLLALNAFKRFVETAIQAKSANNTPYMRILDDDPRQFAMDSVGFTSAVKSICEKAGMHALAEAITSLYKCCHPVMEVQQQNAENPIVTDDDDDDETYDPEFGPVNSGSENSYTCMICGKPCGIGSFRGGSVVCPDCEYRRWHR